MSSDSIIPSNSMPSIPLQDADGMTYIGKNFKIDKNNVVHIFLGNKHDDNNKTELWTKFKISAPNIKEEDFYIAAYKACVAVRSCYKGENRKKLDSLQDHKITYNVSIKEEAKGLDKVELENTDKNIKNVLENKFNKKKEKLNDEKYRYNPFKENYKSTLLAETQNKKENKKTPLEEAPKETYSIISKTEKGPHTKNQIILKRELPASEDESTTGFTKATIPNAKRKDPKIGMNHSHQPVKEEGLPNDPNSLKIFIADTRVGENKIEQTPVTKFFTKKRKNRSEFFPIQ